MKKLFVAAVLALGATVASAQSSVTIYGILDVGYTGVNTRAGSTKTQTNKFDQNAQQSSRLGLKGTEDLGNGTSAFFTAEFQLYPQDATLSGQTTNGLVNRQTFVGIKKSGLGQGAIGTQYTPLFNSVAATDPGAINNATGSIIYPSNGTGVTTSAFTSRSSNAVTIQSESFKGARLGAMYAANNKDTTQTGPNTGGNTNINGYGINADYTWNKLFLTAAYQSFKNENPSATVTPVTTANTYDNGSNAISNETYVGGTYDFGILKAYAGWINRKAISVLDSNQYLNRSGQQVGVRGFITPKIEGWASVGNGQYRAFGNGQPTANFVGYQAGANYFLSKRTNLYTIVGSTHTTSEGGATSAGANQYALGLKHTF